MKHSQIALFGASALILSCLLAQSDETVQMQVPNPANPNGAPFNVTVPKIPASTMYPQISLKNLPKDKALQLYVQNLQRDHAYDWKVALNFYGKVVDENNLPVVGATAQLMWNTVAVPSGTAVENVISDMSGQFSLVGQCGKILLVRVEKNGYYTVDGGKGSLNFEFADPSSLYWYEPDPNKPIIFHLRKKGAGANLFSKSISFGIKKGELQEKRLNLAEGFIRPDGNLAIDLDDSHYRRGVGRFPWTVILRMNDGGMIETSEQFPFLAPTSGYSPSVTVTMDNLDEGIWCREWTKTFYFFQAKTKTYGRLAVTASTVLPIKVDIAYNLDPGDRILEPASQ